MKKKKSVSHCIEFMQHFVVICVENHGNVCCYSVADKIIILNV